MQCRWQLCKSVGVAESCTVASKRRSGAPCSLSLDARSSLDPAAGWDVKAASARSLDHKDLWRRLRVRCLAWGVPGRTRQREAGPERSWLREAANCSCVELSGQASENGIRHSVELFGRRCSWLCHSLSRLMPLLERCVLAGRHQPR